MDGNIIDLVQYSHVDRWEDNPLARRVAYRLAHRSIRERTWAAQEAKDYAGLDALDREWEVLSRY